MGDDSISDEDKALFRSSVGAVKPLAPKKTKVKPKKQPISVKVNRQKGDQPSNRFVYLSSEYQAPISANMILSYRASDFPVKRFKELQKGQIPWQSRLDLHGMRVEDASDALKQFILKEYDKGHRCVLIIHGKGGHTSDVSIIKSYVNHWLQQFTEVLAFTSTLPKDGGTGSVYVLLKRKISETFDSIR